MLGAYQAAGLVPKAVAGGGSGFLLQDYPTAALAVSLRDLTGTNPNVVRVQRSSDNTEQDFSTAEVTDGTLTSWVGAGNDGRIRTWYDQSGNSNNASQLTFPLMPLIVEGGSLIQENSKPAIKFTGFPVFLLSDNDVASQPTTYFTVSRYTDLSGDEFTDIMDGDSSAQRQLIDVTTGKYRIFASASLVSPVSATTDLVLRYSLFNTTASQLAINGGTAQSGDAGSNSSGRIRIGRNSSNLYLKGTISEIIVYDSNKSADRAGIETNINNHYGVY